jgi:hypothetical protein
VICVMVGLRGSESLPNTSVGALLAGSSLVFEAESRRREVALFLVPKVLECLGLLLARRGLEASLPLGPCLGLVGGLLCVLHTEGEVRDSYLARGLALFVGQL